jgi:hypothetical protein
VLSKLWLAQTHPAKNLASCDKAVKKRHRTSRLGCPELARR